MVHFKYSICLPTYLLLCCVIVLGVFKTMCIIDITYYPFDEQRCELTFGSWSYNTGKVW